MKKKVGRPDIYKEDGTYKEERCVFLENKMKTEIDNNDLESAVETAMELNNYVAALYFLKKNTV